MLRFHVANMTCGGCVKGVTRAVQKVAADAQVDVDLGKREVTVTGAQDGNAVLEAIRGAGFEATSQ
jgi:copper chaperone